MVIAFDCYFLWKKKKIAVDEKKTRIFINFMIQWQRLYSTTALAIINLAYYIIKNYLKISVS